MSKKDRLGPIVRALVGVKSEYLGTIADIVNRLNSSNAAAWNTRLKEASQHRIGSLVFKKKISVPDSGRFVAADVFVEDNMIDEADETKIGALSRNFKKLFLSKIETHVPAFELNLHELKRESGFMNDSEVIAILGGEKAVEFTLGQFWNYIRQEASGGSTHTAYVRDDQGKLWSIWTEWVSGNRLNIGACELDDDDAEMSSGIFLSH